MKQILLDVETTGLDPKAGHRIIEIGCVELVNRRYTGQYYHQYIFPGRKIEKGAGVVHGITDQFLEGKPFFHEIVENFFEFIRNSELIIHNAPFDVGFIDHELALANFNNKIEEQCAILDTLLLARKKHPGSRNSLDALCKRYGIDNTHRQYHGALLDARILGDVYLAMTSGQRSLSFLEYLEPSAPKFTSNSSLKETEPSLGVILASDYELAEHQKYLKKIQAASGKVLWEIRP